MKKRKILTHVFSTTLIALLCASVMFVMAGCGSDKTSDSSSNTATAAGDSTAKDSKKAAGKEVKLAEFSVKSKDGKEVLLGMKKEDVVKLLGEGKEGTLVGTYDYGQLNVSYKEDTVHTMMFQRMSSDEQSEYTFKGIKLGDKKADVLKALGDPSKPFMDMMEDKAEAVYTYKVDGENGIFVASEKDMMEDKSKTAYIKYTFDFRDDDVLDCITALYVDLK